MNKKLLIPAAIVILAIIIAGISIIQINKSYDIPILMYHSLCESEDGVNSETVTADKFEQDMKWLKENGYKIYLLSNTSYNYTKFFKEIPGSEYFDGKVVSCELKMIKPELGIYNHLLDKYSLKAEETVFIDNSHSNVEAAMCLGIKGIVFHGDYKEVRDKLIVQYIA